MAHYRLQLHPNIHTVIAFGEPLTAETLAGMVPGAVVHEIASIGLGYPVSLDVEVTRRTREEALDELFTATQQLGYTIIDGEIAEVVDATVQSVALGIFGGFGLGTALDSPVTGLILAAVGGLAGDWVSSELLNHEVIYHVRRVHPGGRVYAGEWEITAVPAQTEAPLVQLARLLAPS